MTELEKAKEFNRRIKAALETVYEALNPGQRIQVLRDAAVKELFERYGVGADE